MLVCTLFDNLSTDRRYSFRWCELPACTVHLIVYHFLNYNYIRTGMKI
jgi:hypothetical protein